MVWGRPLSTHQIVVSFLRFISPSNHSGAHALTCSELPHFEEQTFGQIAIQFYTHPPTYSVRQCNCIVSMQQIMLFMLFLSFMAVCCGNSCHRFPALPHVMVNGDKEVSADQGMISFIGLFIPQYLLTIHSLALQCVLSTRVATRMDSCSQKSSCAQSVTHHL